MYDITVADAHEFYANGVLVGNCDALRYAVMSRSPAPLFEQEEEELDPRERHARHLIERAAERQKLWLPT